MYTIKERELKFYYPKRLSYLGRGKEGIVWQTRDRLAYKQFIHLGFHEYEHSKQTKIELLSTMDLTNSSVIKALVINDNGDLRGYLMELEKRSYYIHKLPIKDQLFILTTVLKTIQEQQQIPIYNMDLSFQNILINKEKQPIFIDLDNFHVKNLIPESFPPKLKYCMHIYSYLHLYDFQLLCFSLYIVEVISRTDIDFSLNRGIQTIQNEVRDKINEIIKTYHFTEELRLQFLSLFRSNYSSVTIEEIALFLHNFSEHLEQRKQVSFTKKYIKR